MVCQTGPAARWHPPGGGGGGRGVCGVCGGACRGSGGSVAPRTWPGSAICQSGDLYRQRANRAIVVLCGLGGQAKIW